MTIEYSPSGADAQPNVTFKSRELRTVASYKRELIRHRRTETGLRQALARDEALLSKKDDLIQRQAVLSQEFDHRLLNGLQMIVSLLSLQSRASTNAELLRNWLLRPIELPRLGVSTTVSTRLTACKLLRLNNTLKTYVAISP